MGKIFKFRIFRSDINKSCFISIDWGHYTGCILFYNDKNLYFIDKKNITLFNKDKKYLNGLPMHSRCLNITKIIGNIKDKDIYVMWEDIFVPNNKDKLFFLILKHEIDWMIQGLLIGYNSTENRCYYMNTPCKIMKKIFGEGNEKNGVKNYIKNIDENLYNVIKNIKDNQHSFDSLFHLFYYFQKSDIDKIYINNIIIYQNDIKNISFKKMIKIIK